MTGTCLGEWCTNRAVRCCPRCGRSFCEWCWGPDATVCSVCAPVAVGVLAGAWKRFGRCRGANPGLFFPVDGGAVDAARAICACCPVRVQCLEYALANHEQDGVWGGTSERERAQFWRRERRQREPR